MNNIVPQEIERIISLFKELSGIGRRGGGADSFFFA